MRVGAADVPVRRLVRSQCVYVTVGTTRTAMKEIVLMTIPYPYIVLMTYTLKAYWPIHMKGIN